MALGRLGVCSLSIAAALVALTTTAAAQAAFAAAPCNCAAATLVGDRVSMTTTSPDASTQPQPLSAVVDANNAEFNWSLQAGANGNFTGQADVRSATITVRMLQPPSSGFAGGTRLKFSGLDPIAPPGCPTRSAKIANILIHTNKENAAFIRAGTTFGPHEVSIPLAPAGATRTVWTATEFVTVQLTLDCDHAELNPCCPPWNAGAMQQTLHYDGAEGIGGRYTLRFKPTDGNGVNWINRIQAYLDYVNSLNPALTTINLKFDMYYGGRGLTATVLTSQFLATHTVTWTANRAPPVPPAFFDDAIMHEGNWYVIQSKIYLNNDANPAVGSPLFFPRACAVNKLDVRVLAVADKKTIQTHRADVRLVDLQQEETGKLTTMGVATDKVMECSIANGTLGGELEACVRETEANDNHP